MTADRMNSTPGAHSIPEVELTDADILDAMRHIPGYIDITTDDFRIIFHLAHAHAVERLFCGRCARDLMRTGIVPLAPATPLGVAARSFVQQGIKTLPVVGRDASIEGVLTETDVLRQLGATSFLEFLLQLIEGADRLDLDFADTPTSAMMTVPAITVTEEAGASEIVAAFRRHPGRGMPVVDTQGHCVGILLRKDFLTASHLGEAL
jgi:CBS-domain-containing membrane protein